jgi:hypothetical protein
MKNLRNFLFTLIMSLVTFALGAQDLTSFKGEGGKPGFKDGNGNIVIPAKYSSVVIFQTDTLSFYPIVVLA